MNCEVSTRDIVYSLGGGICEDAEAFCSLKRTVLKAVMALYCSPFFGPRYIIIKIKLCVSASLKHFHSH